MKHLTLIILIAVAGCMDDSYQQGAPMPTVPVIDANDPQSIADWEASKYNISDSKIEVIKLKFLHGSIAPKPKEKIAVAIEVYGARTKGIAPEQQAAIDDLLKNESAIFATIRTAIYGYYKKAYPSYKTGISMFATPSQVNSILPVVKNGNELDNLVLMGEIYIHQVANGKVNIGMDFEVPWDEEHGIGLQIQAGQIVTIGTGHEAFPL